MSLMLLALNIKPDIAAKTFGRSFQAQPNVLLFALLRGVPSFIEGYFGMKVPNAECHGHGMTLRYMGHVT